MHIWLTEGGLITIWGPFLPVEIIIDLTAWVSNYTRIKQWYVLSMVQYHISCFKATERAYPSTGAAPWQERQSVPIMLALKSVKAKQPSIKYQNACVEFLQSLILSTEICCCGRCLQSRWRNTGVFARSWWTAIDHPSLETARLDVVTIVSLWHLTNISTALLPRCLSNFRAIRNVLSRFSRLPRLRDILR